MEVDYSVVVSPSTMADLNASPRSSTGAASRSRRQSVGFNERTSSHNSRHSGRISGRSSVRDEAQTSHELLRKQRVVRCMQIERERAARSKMERAEHDDWLRLRSMERSEVVHRMTDEQIVEMLQREAREIERERLEAEEAIRRGAEEAAARQRLRTRQNVNNRNSAKVSQCAKQNSKACERLDQAATEGAASSDCRLEVSGETKSEPGQSLMPQMTETESCREGASESLFAMVKGTPESLRMSVEARSTPGGKFTPKGSRTYAQRIGSSEATSPAVTAMASVIDSPISVADRSNDTMARLRRAQEDIVALRDEVRNAKQSQQEAEAKLRMEAERADNEAQAKRMFAKRADTYKASVEELQRRTAEVEEELQTLRQREKNDQTVQKVKDELKMATEQIRALEEENKDLKDRQQELYNENARLSANARRRASGISQSELLPEFDAVSEGGSGDMNASDTEMRNRGQDREALGSFVVKYNMLVDQFEELQRQSAEQQLELQRIISENKELKNRSHGQPPAASKRQPVSEATVRSEGTSGDGKEIEHLRWEAKKYKQEAIETRKELKALKESSENEISSLKEWCERLKVKCKRQTDDIKKYMSQNKAVDATKGETKKKSPDTAEDVDGAKAACAAEVGRLQDEILQLRSRLSESTKKEQAAISLAESLKREKADPYNRDKRKEEELQRQVDTLTRTVKERREAEARWKESQQATENELKSLLAELTASRKTIENLKHEVSSLREEQKACTPLKQEHSDENAELRLTVTAINTENEELREKIATLQKELEELRRRYIDLEREAEERNAKAQKEINELRRENENLRRPPATKVNSKKCC
ncbi:hypothetical protein, conserved [Trypanosoma brucei gambiense DAL972]|uniref:Uncharacterized protein n=1 Tax=Trypanosoma brucei gambiense (strain MHOM/CI/86/DAL972) TaxID=679716 RepID=C9ZWI7_TRYB9|nr:hypothetical protein, conserved [Trypanosoma brucei gambiense DAL972]CBH13776.1 hypothetical protein, conserved [Trypanosoma brucei gambiense DAL972]|eukprot:XP_011776052.1 hypothetical protein, conserved [Trypanosoma brucei gambiense DAL972]